MDRKSNEPSPLHRNVYLSAEIGSGTSKRHDAALRRQSTQRDFATVPQLGVQGPRRLETGSDEDRLIGFGAGQPSDGHPSDERH